MTEPPAPHVHPEGGNFAVLTKKIGPAPGWVYLVGMTALYIAYRYYVADKATKGATSGNGVAGDTAATSPTDDGTGSPDFDGPVATNEGGTTGIVNTTPVGPTTNGAWSQAAIVYLTGGGASAVDANNAVYDYIHGKQLTSAQQTLVGRALDALGALPGGALPVLAVPNPATANIPKALPANKTPYTPLHHQTKAHTVKARPGDTLTGLSEAWYGSPQYWAVIKDANPGKHLGGAYDRIAANTVIKIPAK